MSRISIVEIHDTSWSSFVEKSCNYDFYHTRSYHLAETEGKVELPLLFVCELDSNFIALPLVIRNIEGSDYKDCTSVYGYCGPISNLMFNEIPESLRNEFQTGLVQFFCERNIIAAFSRLHPLISNEGLFNGQGEIRDINKTVAIDLSLSLDDQRRQFRKSNKSEINQLRKKKGYTVKEAKSIEEIKTFAEIYKKNMQRVSATDYYFFDLDYFMRILENPDYDARLLLAMHNEVITAGAIFTITKKIMQYHLAGTKEEFMKDTPMKLLLDEARIIGYDLGLDFLHLGGGVGGSDEDFLFRFKSGFSKHRCQYKTWQFIVNQEAYDFLVSKMKSRQKSSFFPLYRS